MPRIVVMATEREKKMVARLAGGQISEYIRLLIAADAARRGELWPDELRDTRGKYLRKKPES